MMRAVGDGVLPPATGDEESAGGGLIGRSRSGGGEETGYFTLGPRGGRNRGGGMDGGGGGGMDGGGAGPWTTASKTVAVVAGDGDTP
jgi:hypothetical protein